MFGFQTYVNVMCYEIMSMAASKPLTKLSNLLQNGFLSASPFLGTFISGIIYSYFIDQLVHRKKISVITTRRLSMAIGN